MPSKDMPLNELKNYTGVNPCPSDFGDFWDLQLEKIHNTEIEFTITDSEIPHTEQTRIVCMGTNGRCMPSVHVVCRISNGRSIASRF